MIGLLVFIAIAGIILWGVGQFPVLDPTLKRVIQVIIYVVVAITVIVWVAGVFGYRMPVPSFR